MCRSVGRLSLVDRGAAVPVLAANGPASLGVRGPCVGRGRAGVVSVAGVAAACAKIVGVEAVFVVSFACSRRRRTGASASGGGVSRPSSPPSAVPRRSMPRAG